MAPIKADNELVYQEYENRQNLFECMYFEENKKTWESIAESFVLDNGNSNLKNFVKRVQ